jgi:hypothetical protein
MRYGIAREGDGGGRRREFLRRLVGAGGQATATETSSETQPREEDVLSDEANGDKKMSATGVACRHHHLKQ